MNNGALLPVTLGWVIVADDSKIEIMSSDTLAFQEADTVCLTATGPVPDCVVWTNIEGDSIVWGAELCVVPVDL